TRTLEDVPHYHDGASWQAVEDDGLCLRCRYAKVYIAIASNADAPDELARAASLPRPYVDALLRDPCPTYAIRTREDARYELHPDLLEAIRSRDNSAIRAFMRGTEG